MQEEVEKKTVSLAIQAIKLTFHEIEAAWRKFQNEQSMKRAYRQKDTTKHGKQSVKELIGQGQGVSMIDVADVGLKDFKKMAQKYGVDFAVVKDKNVDPPKYTIFFKAKDADAINKLMTDYAAKQLKKEQKAERPSILKKLQKFKEFVAKLPRKEHEKRKEHER